MCGNFGLLLLKSQSAADHSSASATTHRTSESTDALLKHVDTENSIKSPQPANGRTSGQNEADLLPAIHILEAQTAATEVRGGQAGGYSALEFLPHKSVSSGISSGFGSANNDVGAVYGEPNHNRVRCVARKRHPLAKDLAQLFVNVKKRNFSEKATVSVIGHTRFATSSVNTVPELHPHEWVPFQPETVWIFNTTAGIFERHVKSVGINITHNGDFDALEAYGQKIVVDYVGLWLERVLYIRNDLKGDSPKVAGCMDLFRVQGRWGPSARLAWIRCILRSVYDVSDGSELSKQAPNSFPSPSYFAGWATFVEAIWRQHINNIINIIPPSGLAHEKTQLFRYSIDRPSEQLLVKNICEILQMKHEKIKSSDSDNAGNDKGQSNGNNVYTSIMDESFHENLDIRLEDVIEIRKKLAVESWSNDTMKSFVSTMVRGFLRNDLYNCLIEFLSRAEGSFGVQVHCSLEPGVVVIGSKGQPMSMSYDPNRPICLFASQAEACAVPIDNKGGHLTQRIDLDSRGEIIRIGHPRTLYEGTFAMTKENDAINQSVDISDKSGNRTMNPEASYGSSAMSYLQNMVHGNKFEVSTIHYEDVDEDDDEEDDQRDWSQSNKLSVWTEVEKGPIQVFKSEKISRGALINKTNTGSMAFGLSLSAVSKGKSSKVTFDNIFDKKSNGVNFSESVKNSLSKIKSHKSTRTISYSSKSGSRSLRKHGNRAGLILDSGIEIRGYSLVSHGEETHIDLLTRSMKITTTPLPYDPTVDLVEKDLRELPGVLSKINDAWDSSDSRETVSGKALAEVLVTSLLSRHHNSSNTSRRAETLDLVIGGIEISLWVAEQFASDLRKIFPQLNIVTFSANKLLTVGDENPGKVFFPGADSLLPHRFDGHTCALLISQSGQTFPTLHATRNLSALVGDRLWLLTGSYDSKMKNVLMESYHKLHKNYKNDRIFSNYSENRPAEPASLAVAATWHTLTRLLLCIVTVSRKMCPNARVMHPWTFESLVIRIQRCYRAKKEVLKLRSNAAKHRRNMDATLQLLKTITDPSSQNISSMSGKLLIHSESKRGRLRHLKHIHHQSQVSSGHGLVMLLSDGCIHDIQNLLQENVVRNMSFIVGYDEHGKPLNSSDSVHGHYRPGYHEPVKTTYESIPHSRLVHQGRAWGRHLNEPWQMLVIAGFYILFSVGLGLPICGLIADGIAWIVFKALGDTLSIPRGPGIMAFTPRTPHIILQQDPVWTAIGLFIQILDALFFIYIVKNFTRISRFLGNRAIGARHGKRTIVIVDNPCIHQLAENFCSKLFAQGYSFNTPEVHGSAGEDHFVHRFTHRVARGLLLVIGRPDGRLCCLAKSEASVLLAAKQAAFIRNPAYHCKGSGPEIVTIGHNPYKPSLGLCKNITLQAVKLAQYNSLGNILHYSFKKKTPSSLFVIERKKFLDEFVFERCYKSARPFTRSVLRYLVRIHHPQGRWGRFILPYGCHHIDPLYAKAKNTNKSDDSPLLYDFIMQSKDLLIAASHQKSAIDTEEGSDLLSVTAASEDDGTMADSLNLFDDSYKAGCNPNERLAFLSRLDSNTQTIEELQTIVQQFYECRVAAMERYIAYCVMFHAMAKECSKPWLCTPWDVARSQSNLRIATTASPIMASSAGESKEVSKDAMIIMKTFALKIRGYKLAF